MQGSILRTINALTLCTRDMAKSCAFYSKLGLTPTFGGSTSAFTTFSASKSVREENNFIHINLVLAKSYVQPPKQPGVPGGWGRAVIFVDDVDALHASISSAGIEAPTPRDAPWGERYFHVSDPDGHELSFATPDYSHPRWHASPAEGAAADDRPSTKWTEKESSAAADGGAAGAAGAAAALEESLQELRAEQQRDRRELE